MSDHRHAKTMSTAGLSPTAKGQLVSQLNYTVGANKRATLALSPDCPGTLSPHCPGVVVVHCSFCPNCTYYKFSNSSRFCYILWNTIASFLTVSISFSNASLIFTFVNKQGKQCFQRWNRCVRFKVVRLSSLIPLDLRHAEQLLFLCPCSNLTVYRRSFFAHPLCASLSCLQYGI